MSQVVDEGLFDALRAHIGSLLADLDLGLLVVDDLLVLQGHLYGLADTILEAASAVQEHLQPRRLKEA